MRHPKNSIKVLEGGRIKCDDTYIPVISCNLTRSHVAHGDVHGRKSRQICHINAHINKPAMHWWRQKGYNEYSHLNTTIQSELDVCLVKASSVPTGITIDLGCANQIYGRYVYISLLRGSNGDGHIQLAEVEVYMGKWINEHIEIYRTTSLTNLQVNDFKIEPIENTYFCCFHCTIRGYLISILHPIYPHFGLINNAAAVWLSLWQRKRIWMPRGDKLTPSRNTVMYIIIVLYLMLCPGCVDWKLWFTFFYYLDFCKVRTQLY